MEVYYSYIILLMACWSTHNIIGVSSSVFHRQLLDKLFDPNNYNNLVRPVKDGSINVTMQLVLTGITAVEEMNHQIELNVWIRQVWRDAYLFWNETEVGGKGNLVVPSELIWLPDITLYNSVGDSDRFENERSYVRIHSDGTVRWGQKLTLRSACELVLTNFPFDDQECALRFGSWNFDGSLLNLDIPSGDKSVGFDVHSEYHENSEWDLKSAKAYRKIIKYNFTSNDSDLDENQVMTWPEIYFSLKLKRKSNFYLFTLLIPYFLISSLSGLVFFLQPESGEKMSLAITTLLSLVVFNEYVMEIVPPSADVFPLLTEYFLVMMFWVSACVFISAWILHIHYQDSKDCVRMSPWLRVIIFIYMLRIVGWWDKQMKNNSTPTSKLDQYQRSYMKRKTIAVVDLNVDDDGRAEQHSALSSEIETESSKVTNDFKRGMLESEVHKISHFLLSKEQEELQKEEEEAPLQEWRDAAKIVDKFFFLLYTFMNIFLAVVFALKAVVRSG